VHSLTPLEDMVAESIRYIKDNEPKDQPYYIGFSGGKDSIVTLALAKMAGVEYKAYYCCTRIEFPELYKFIKKEYPEVIWKYPTKTFYNYLRTRSVPTRLKRWCCDSLKKSPTCISKVPLKHRMLGLRAEESRARSLKPRTDAYTNYRGNCLYHMYKPIFYWKEWHVWEFIDKYNIPYPSLYDEGYKRLGCIFCPFVMYTRKKDGTNEIFKLKERYPKLFKVYEKVVLESFKELLDRYGTLYGDCTTPKEALAKYYSGRLK
jgi:phosphoadenosine phosphosulfate reductase